MKNGGEDGKERAGDGGFSYKNIVLTVTQVTRHPRHLLGPFSPNTCTLGAQARPQTRPRN